jgi:hypothetical protein
MRWIAWVGFISSNSAPRCSNWKAACLRSPGLEAPTAAARFSVARRLVRHSSRTGLTGHSEVAPALRTALQGWLGYIDAAILDWIEHDDLTRGQVRDLLLIAFGATVQGAQQLDPTIQLAPGS